ncbi:MAG TPA: hypothetical protein PLX49_08445, partial [Prolixibacteraceae bacterium]|nr:hypothetical protein [Prolixibacteraceae bacterium]
HTTDHHLLVLAFLVSVKPDWKYLVIICNHLVEFYYPPGAGGGYLYIRKIENMFKKHCKRAFIGTMASPPTIWCSL